MEDNAFLQFAVTPCISLSRTLKEPASLAVYQWGLKKIYTDSFLVACPNMRGRYVFIFSSSGSPPRNAGSPAFHMEMWMCSATSISASEFCSWDVQTITVSRITAVCIGGLRCQNYCTNMNSWFLLITICTLLTRACTVRGAESWSSVRKVQSQVVESFLVSP